MAGEVIWSLQHRRDTAANWASNNPTLLDGQIGIETDTRKFKIGDGSTEWNSNPNYYINIADLQILLDEKADRENELLTGGGLTVGTFGGSGTNNDVRVAAATYFIVGTGVVSSSQFTFNDLALSSAGTQRFVGFYGDAVGSISKVEGAEATLATFPATPAGNVLFGYVLISDASVSGTPDLSGYLLKSDKATAAEVVTGTEDSKYITPKGISDSGKYQLVTNKSIDGTFAANSDTLYPSQKAVRTFVLANAGTPSLTSTYIGHGNGSNQLSGDANFTRDATTGKVRIGNADGGSGYSEDVESMLVVARTTVLATSQNAHGFVDATRFQRTSNGFAYNSYRNNVVFLGSANYDHYSFFENNFTHGGSGTLSHLYGHYDGSVVSSGATVTNRYAVYVANPTGSGTLTNNYGLYVPTQSKGSTLNYGIFVVSNDCYFGGRIRMISTSGSANALTAEVAFYHATNTKTSYVVNKLLANSSNLQFYVSQAALNAALNIFELVGDNGNGLGTVNGSVFANGKVKIGNNSSGAYPVAWLTLPASTTAANTAPMRVLSGTLMTTAEAGAMEYNNTFHLTNSDATRRHVVLAPNTTKVTAAAPYTNDGYITVNIGGTDFKLMTTA